MEKNILQDVRELGLTGFLKHSHDKIGVKLGGTAVAEVLQAGQDSRVLQGIRQLQSRCDSRLVFVVSAAGKVFNNPQKITDRLIAALQAIQSKAPDSQTIAQDMLEKLKEDHLKMAVNALPDEKKIILNR